jgi:hypothetical protein
VIALKVLIIVLGLLVLLLTVRLGVDIGYDDVGLRVYARVSRFTFCIYPTPKQASKKPKKQKSKSVSPCFSITTAYLTVLNYPRSLR